MFDRLRKTHAARLSVLAVFIPVAASVAAPAGFLQCKGPDIVDAGGKVFLPRGIGLGEWYNTEAYMVQFPGKDVGGFGASKIRSALIDLMGKDSAEEFYRRWEGNIATEQDVEQWARWGVNSIRLSFNYHSLSTADGVWVEEGFQTLDRIIGWCRKNNIYVVLDMHAAPGAQSNELMSDCPDGVARLWTEPDKYQPWAIHLWRKIAERYANEPAVAGFNIMDEPILPKGQTVEKHLRPFYVAVTKAIREVNKKHILFFDGPEWSRDFTGLETPWDENMVYCPHKYWDKNDQSSIRKFLDLRAKANRPFYNAETGENTNEWVRDMVQLCERNGIGWNFWTYKKVNSRRQPYTIVRPPDYDKVINFLAGKGPRPSREQATKILLTLADNAATAKCEFNPGVIEALFGKKQ